MIQKIKINSNTIHPLQTTEWANFRKEWGNEVEKINKNLITFSKIPYTKYTIGTILKGSDICKLNLDLIRKTGKKFKAIFIKFEPNVLYDKNLAGKYKKMGLVEGKTLFTPTTFVIDLTKSETDLLKNFSGKTRYNIRLAQRKGVIVVEDSSTKAFEKYLKLTFETAKRQGFYAHTQKYHKLMWKHLHLQSTAKKSQPIAHLLTAKYKNKIITTWILFSYNKVLYYPYGASSEKYKNVMANNLMMWEAIKFGKKLGCNMFDLWGREEGKGFTRFKEGYNPEIIECIGSWDLIIDKKLYHIYQMLDKWRWMVLHLKRKFFAS